MPHEITAGGTVPREGDALGEHAEKGLRSQVATGKPQNRVLETTVGAVRPPRCHPELRATSSTTTAQLPDLLLSGSPSTPSDSSGVLPGGAATPKTQI